MTHKRYYPVIRSKPSEWLGLNAVRRRSRTNVSPIVELTEGVFRTPDLHKERSKWWDKHLREIRQIALGYDEVLLDLSVYAEENFKLEQRDVWDELLKVFNSASGLIPVVRFDWTSAGLKRAISAAKKWKHGIAIRVLPKDLADVSVFRANLTNWLLDHRVRPEGITLVFDFIDNPTLVSFDALRKGIPFLESWRNWVVVSGTFPEFLSEYSNRQQLHKRPRIEWNSWAKQVIGVTASRHPAYGDYLMFHAPSSMNIALRGSFSLRYTLDSDTMILRGNRKNGARQFVGHARLLHQRSLFYGENFSAGDAFLAGNIRGARTLDQSIWRASTINHHIEVTVAQVLDEKGSSDAARKFTAMSDDVPPTLTQSAASRAKRSVVRVLSAKAKKMVDGHAALPEAAKGMRSVSDAQTPLPTKS